MQAQAQKDSLEQARGRGRQGGALATLISAFALAFSAYTFYEAVMRSPEIAVFVPPRIEYTDPDRPDSPFEVFIVPVTILNDGARTATVLSVDLDVRNPRSGAVKRFYAARVGGWAAEQPKPFAPVSLPGRGIYSDAIQFFPRRGETVARLPDLEAGSYEFKLTLSLAGNDGAQAPPLAFVRRIDQLDYRNFNGRGTMEMWADDYRPAATPAK